MTNLQRCRHHYAIFWTLPIDNRALWCRARTKAAALIHARAVGGLVVAVSYGHDSGWDAPTFKASGDVIADYRPKGGTI